MTQLKQWLLYPLGVLARILYPYRLARRFQSVRDDLYTIWIRPNFGQIGQHSSIYYPCILQGKGEKQIEIGDFTTIQGHCVLGCWNEYGHQHFQPSLVIGSHCDIGEYNQISACNKVTIGDGLLTGRYVYIGDNSHGTLSWDEAGTPPAQRELQSKDEIRIGRHVWIGDKATILAGVTIGDNVIIGANSVVTRDIPSNCIAAGAPARIVKQL